MSVSGRRGSEKKKRVKMADLRTLIETKILSKSDRALERVGLDVVTGKRLEHVVKPFLQVSQKLGAKFAAISFQEYHRSLDTNEVHLSRSASVITRTSSTNLVKGKSMPSLRYVLKYFLRIFLNLFYLEQFLNNISLKL